MSQLPPTCSGQPSSEPSPEPSSEPHLPTCPDTNGDGGLPDIGPRGRAIAGSNRFRKRGRARQAGHRRPSPYRHRRQRLVVNLLLICRHDRPNWSTPAHRLPAITSHQRIRPGCVAAGPGPLLVALAAPCKRQPATGAYPVKRRCTPVTLPNTVPAQPDRATRLCRARQPPRPGAQPGCLPGVLHLRLLAKPPVRHGLKSPLCSNAPGVVALPEHREQAGVGCNNPG